MQAIDTAAFLYDLHYSDTSDEWTVTSTASKVQLNPSPADISGLGSQVLTASVLGVENLTGYSFHWTTTTTIGDLSDMASGGQASPNRLLLRQRQGACSSSNLAQRNSHTIRWWSKPITARIAAAPPAELRRYRHDLDHLCAQRNDHRQPARQ